MCSRFRKEIFTQRRKGAKNTRLASFFASLRLCVKLLFLLLATACVTSKPAPVAVAPQITRPAGVLRVCADPNNLPFSDEGKEGFENKIAQLIGAELSLKVEYVWFPQVIGFVRNTLRAHLCDLVMGTVAGDDVMQTTNPYYFTTYTMFYLSLIHI